MRRDRVEPSRGKEGSERERREREGSERGREEQDLNWNAYKDTNGRLIRVRSPLIHMVRDLGFRRTIISGTLATSEVASGHYFSAMSWAKPKN